MESLCRTCLLKKKQWESSGAERCWGSAGRWLEFREACVYCVCMLELLHTGALPVILSEQLVPQVSSLTPSVGFYHVWLKHVTFILSRCTLTLLVWDLLTNTSGTFHGFYLLSFVVLFSVSLVALCSLINFFWVLVHVCSVLTCKFNVYIKKMVLMTRCLCNQWVVIFTNSWRAGSSYAAQQETRQAVTTNISDLIDLPFVFNRLWTQSWRFLKTFFYTQRSKCVP